MPIFDFVCPRGHVFEQLVKLSDLEYTRCYCGELAKKTTSPPHIGGVAARKIKDRALQNPQSNPVSVTVPRNYNKKNNATNTKGKERNG